MHEILQQESLLVLVVVKLTKMRKKYSKFENSPRYLVWYKMHEFLSSVFYLHTPPDNLPGILQKGSKFACFWAEIHELHVLLSVSGPMVVKTFPGVEIRDFHLQKT